MSETCWLYGRFSTGEQKEGDSRERQERMARTWARPPEKVLTRIFFDEGISGGKGREKRRQLDAMLAELETGKPPDYLLVDDPDRLSRQKPMEALKLWEHILDFCQIVDMRGNEVYSKATWQSTKLFLILTLKVSLANEEREKRIERGKGSWQRKREAIAKGTLLTRSVPAWLNKDRSRDEKRVKTIQAIFQWYADGLGIANIAARLRERKVAPMGKGKKGNPKDWHWLSAGGQNQPGVGESKPAILR